MFFRSPPSAGAARIPGLEWDMPHSARGIVLILVTGLLALLAFLAAALAQGGRFSAAWSAVETPAGRARRAAESALEYAAARLWADARSIAGSGKAPSAANRCDDRVPRGNEPPVTPPHRLKNPSYARGDGWKDQDNDGAFDPGEAIQTGGDLDGDGRFDAWSGRLRGGSRDSGRFSLVIRCADALVSVNGGEIGSPTDDHDLDGVLNGDPASGYAAAVPAAAHRDPAYPGNVHLVNLLDNLGAVLDLSIEQTGVLYHAGAPQLGADETSPLGTLAVSNRPKGGYASLEPLRAALPPADFEKVAPFLTTRRRTVPVSHPSGGLKKDLLWERIASPVWKSAYEFHAPIRFNEAPVEILKASLRNITASGSYFQLKVSPPKWNGEITGGPVDAQTPFIRLHPSSEADNVAAALAAQRPIHTWKEFLRKLHDFGASRFEDDPFTSLNDAADPDRILLKEDLILAQVAPDGYFGDTHAWRKNTLEVPRGIPAARRIVKESLFGPLNTVPFDRTGAVITTALEPSEMFSGIPSRATTEYDLAADAPGSFTVRASGWTEPQDGAGPRVELSGEIDILESLRLGGQQEFEMLSTEARPVSPAAPWRLAGGAILAEGPCQEKSSIDSDPKFPLDSYGEASLPVGSGLGWAAGNYAYCPVEGSLRLAARPEEAIDAPCVFALPFNPDPSTDPVNRWYSKGAGTPDDWLDNLGDPVGTPGTHRSPDPVYAGTPYPLRTLHEGFRAGTLGIRLNPIIPAPNLMTIAWDAATPFPIPLDPQMRIADASISLWYPAQGGPSLTPADTLPLNAPFLELSYKDLSAFGNTWRTYLRWEFTSPASEGFQVETQSASHSITPWWTADPTVSACGWHHLAFVFNASGDALTVYADGRPAPLGPIPIGPPAGTPGQEQWRLQLRFPMDDLRFFAPAAGALEIEKQALETDRFAARSGTYLSPRFRPDPSRLPRGATLRSISWDGFIPEQTAGRFVFDAVGYRDGLPLNPDPADPGRAIPWNGSAPPAAAFTVAGCDAFEIGVTIRAETPALAIAGPSGVVYTPLRDTPSLDSITLRFAGDRPRWSNLAER